MASSAQYKPGVRIKHSTQVIGHNLYLFGGFQVPSVHDNDEKRRLTSQIAIFNITSGVWNFRSTSGNAPLGVKGYLCTSINDKIYYFGGWCHHDICYHNSLNELDISTFTWSQLQSTNDSITVMKRGYGGIMSSEQSGQHRLLFIGGHGSPPSIQLTQAQYYQLPNGRVSTNEQNIFDLATGQWIIPEIIGQCMPPNTAFVMEAVNNTRAIIFGGHVEGTTSNTLYILDIINCTVHWHTIARPDPIVQWPEERRDHAASIINGSIYPVLVVTGGLDKEKKTIKDCWILNVNEKSWTKINPPVSVTERCIHSLSTFIVGSHCVWLIAVGGKLQYKGADVLDPNITMLIELSLNDDQWSIGFVLNSHGLSVINTVYDERKSQIKDKRHESSQEKKVQYTYHKELLVAQGNIKSLQERLLDMEFQQVQRNDSYIAKLQKKDEIITMLQKQLQKSNKPISTTSDHDTQQLHDLVQEKDSYIAQLNRKIFTLSKEKEDALQQFKVTSHQQLSVMSSQKTTDIVSYLPKLAVVLQPVQEYWEQLGHQLNIDQSVLTDIRSKGNSIEQMKYLLEEWSLKGGTLTQLEEALLHLDMKHVIPDLTELKESYLSSEKHEEDCKQVSVLSTDIGGIVATKDVECQFNYLVPSIDQLEYLHGTGVHIAGKTLFFIQGERTQLLNWEEYGLRINVPHGTMPPGGTCEVSIAAIVGGKFELPSGTSLVSAVYSISVSKALLQPVQLSIQHCVSLETQEHTSYLSFVTADLYQSVLPYQFKLEKGGQFYPGDQYGSIHLTKFSIKSIVRALIRPIRQRFQHGYDEVSEHEDNISDSSLQNDTGQSPVNLYVGQVVYEIKQQNEWLMRFMVAQHLDALIQYIDNSLPNVEKDVSISFKFQEENGYIELCIGEEQEHSLQGWNVRPHLYPTRISQRVVDKFGECTPPQFPSCLVTVAAIPSDTTVPGIQYSISLKGINLTEELRTPKIYIVRSLATNVQQPLRALLNTETQSEESIPSEIFRTSMADLTKAIASNLDEITDRLFSERFIGQDVLQSTTTEGVSNYRKARKVVHELFNLLQAHRDPKQYLTLLCEVLLKQDDPRLSGIANSIKAKFCL